MTFFDIVKTPLGDAFWAKLDEPDTYNPDNPKYSISLRWKSREDVADMLAHLDDLLKGVVAHHSRGGNKVKVQPLYKNVTDADGNPTGEIELTFARKANKRAIVFDTKGNRVQCGIIGNGSRCAVAFRPYDWTNKGKVGVSNWLESVLLVKLEERREPLENMEDYGFEVPEGGFVADETQVEEQTPF